MKDKVSKLVNVYKKYGFFGFCKKLYAYIMANYMDRISFSVFFNKKKYRNIIKNILNGEYDRVVLWRSSFGFDVELYQRPQHISTKLSENGCIVFYEVSTMTDKVKTLKKHNDLYLFNFNNILLNKILMEELELIDKKKYVQLYSTDWKLSVENIKNYINKGFEFIYEYIDDLSPDLSGTKEIPLNITSKYDYAMANDFVYVVVTADLLYEDVVSKRGNKNVIISSNGVDYNFFQRFDEFELEKNYLDIIKNGKINICYYGALAKWFDYELLKTIADTNLYNVILFGIKYDESYDLNNIDDVKNVYFMGSRPYSVLKYYAKEVDILIIPFLINDITKATSPVKIFEYMALGKMIVTTDMNECRKYESVLTSKSHDEFLKQLKKYGNLDDNYQELLKNDALNNDWKEKALAILKGLK